MIIFSSQLLQKSLNWKCFLALLQFWLQTLVTIDSKSWSRLFPSFALHHVEWMCSLIGIWADYLFSDRSFDLNLLLCTGFDLELVDLLLCHIFTERPMNDHKIELGNELLTPPTILFHMPVSKKIYQNLQNTKTFLTFEVSITRAVALYPQVSLLLLAVTAGNQERPCFCACILTSPSCARPRCLLALWAELLHSLGWSDCKHKRRVFPILQQCLLTAMGSLEDKVLPLLQYWLSSRVPMFCKFWGVTTFVFHIKWIFDGLH